MRFFQKKKFFRRLGKILGVHDARDIALYWANKVRGGTYADYYGKRMDLQISENKNWGLNLEKEFQIEYLVKHGLKKDHDILDYGCGAIAAGRYFIDYLNPGRYVGVDVSAKVVDEANSRVSRFDLESKKPKIQHIEAGRLDSLKGRQFDFIWAQSVLTHMSDTDVESLLSSIGAYMKPGATFFASFHQASTTGHFLLKDWRFSPKFLEDLATANGLGFQVMDDWSHPSAGENDRLARFTRES